MKMKEVYRDQYCYINEYNATDFANNMNEIVDSCSRIIASYEVLDDNNYDSNFDKDYDFEADKEALNNLFMDNLLDDVNYHIYILNLSNTPVGFAIYSQKDDTKSYVLEFIHISKDYTSLGLGSLLLNQSAINLKQSLGAEEIMSTINKNNSASMALHEKFISKNSLKTYINDYSNRMVFHINLSRLNEKVKTNTMPQNNCDENLQL